MSVLSKSRLKVFVPGCLAFLACPGAAAACEVAIVSESSVIRVDYDPFEFVRSAGQTKFELVNKGEQDCELAIILLDDMRQSIETAAISDTGVTLRFAARARQSALVPGGVPGTWRLGLPSGTQTDLVIEALVIEDAIAAAGLHELALTLEIRNLAGDDGVLFAAPLRTELLTRSRAQMNIVGAAGSFGEGENVASVDFGVITANTVRRVYLQMRANTDARLSIDSANRGRLKRNDALPEETGITYGAILSDEEVSLSQHWERIISPPQTVAGSSLPFDLVIGEISAQPAGAYSDVLTIELSAL